MDGAAATAVLQVHREDEVVQTCAYTGTSASALYTLLWPQPISRAATELRRRRWQLALYLLRDPFYRQLLWCAGNIAELLCVSPSTAQVTVCAAQAPAARRMSVDVRRACHWRPVQALGGDP